MRARWTVVIIMVVSISLVIPWRPVSAATATPPGSLATCEGETSLRWSEPAECWAGFSLTNSRAARLVLHPDAGFEGRLTACVFLQGSTTCELYLHATFGAGQPVGPVEGSAEPKLLPPGDWRLSLTAGDNVSADVPPISTPPQIPRVCPLGPVFDPYCWWGVGGGYPVGGGAISQGTAHGRFAGSVVSDDPVPSLRVDDVARAEGNSGTTVFSFTISLSAPTGLASGVSYATADGSAVSGSDYEARSGTLTIPAGETSATVAVPVIGDTTTEADEVFDVNLSSPTNATLADGQGQGTILNDDEPALRVDDVAASEGRSGTKPFSFTVSLSAPTSNSVSVEYATVDGTARSRTDYTPLRGILTIPANQTTATITVDVQGDTKREGDETFYLNLYGPTNSSIADGQGLGSILNDD